MRRHWLKYKLNDIIKGLYDGPHATPPPSDKGPVFLGIKNLTDDGKFNLEETRHIAESDFRLWTKRVLPRKDDIVFTYEATLNRYGLIPEGMLCCLGRRMGLLRLDKKKVNPKFLLYYFQSSEWRQVIDRNIIVGATVNRIPISEMSQFPLFLPEIIEQEKIAKVLSDLDTKIELNNKINKELEAMAKHIYDYWFVQFDFPNEEGKPYKSSGGKMVYNEELKREIPEGWEVGIIGELLSKETKTKKIKSSEYLEIGKYPIIDQSTNFICGYTNDEDSFISTDVPRIVFGDHTRILKLINFDFARGADGTQVLLSNEEKVPQHFFYHSLLKIDLSNYGYARHFKFLKDVKTIIPEFKIANKFEKQATVFYNKILKNQLENQQLTALRDWLLPMLMNGQVSVKKAEESLSMAAEPKGEYKK